MTTTTTRPSIFDRKANNEDNPPTAPIVGIDGRLWCPACRYQIHRTRTPERCPDCLQRILQPEKPETTK